MEDLAKLSIQGVPEYVGVDDDCADATVEKLEQGYIVCPSDKRFLLLFTFLKVRPLRLCGVCVRLCVIVLVCACQCV